MKMTTQEFRKWADEQAKKELRALNLEMVRKYGSKKETPSQKTGKIADT